MGTNYYWHPPPAEKCPTCGHAEKRDAIHIGKSSVGWCFSMHVVPEERLNNLADWVARWVTGRIEDEYGREVPGGEMFAIITKRDRSKIPDICPPNGYTTWTAFHVANNSEPGPLGLWRHRIGRYCVGHGEGTWDLIPGDFS